MGHVVYPPAADPGGQLRPSARVFEREPAFGAAPLSNITPEHLRHWIAKSAVSSSAATVRKNCTVLHQVLVQAVTDGRLATNPATELELPTIDETEKRYLGAQQLQRLADAAGEDGALVLLLGFTGLRFGEAAALTVRDIDLEHGRVRVHRSVYRGGRDDDLFGAQESSGSHGSGSPIPDRCSPRSPPRP